MAPPVAPSRLRVLIDTVPVDFNPATDIALGPWVFAGHLDDHPTWYEHDFPNPFPDDEALGRAYRCCDAIFWEILPRHASTLAKMVEEETGIQMEPVAWQYFVAPWVQSLVFLAWSRYWLVRTALERIGDRPATVQIPAANPRPTLTTGEDILAMVSTANDADNWLTGRAVETLRQLCPRLEVVEDDYRPRARDKAPIGLQPDGPLRRLLGRSPHARFKGAAGVGALWTAAFNAMLAVKRAKRGALPHIPDNGPTTWPEGFERLLGQALDCFRPKLTQVFDSAALADIKAQRYVKGALRFNPPTYWNDHRRLCSAMALSAGEILVGSQHGGMYGIQEPNARPQANEFAFGDFLTWGWSSCGGHRGRFHPLPSPMLSRMGRRHRRRSDDIILVLSKNMYGGEGLFWIRSLKGAANHHRDCLRLLDGVRSLSGTPVLRYFPPFASEIPLPAAQVDGIEILQGPLWKRALGCKLMIASSYGTPLHEALVADVPILQLLTSSPLPLAQEARSHIDRLRSAGIVHDSVDSLLAMAARIGQDVEGWWSSPDVRSARHDFIHHHARQSRLWGICWLQWFLTR